MHAGRLFRVKILSTPCPLQGIGHDAESLSCRTRALDVAGSGSPGVMGSGESTCPVPAGTRVRCR